MLTLAETGPALKVIAAVWVIVVPLADAVMVALPAVVLVTVAVVTPEAFVSAGAKIVSIAPLDEDRVTVAPLIGLL